MSVGITALPMTARMSSEYWSWSMMPWESPKSAEMLPKVSPVYINRVV